MHADVDVGDGLSGTTVMMEQMTMYSTFLNTICLTMQSFEVVAAENSVVVSTKAKLRFQILRSTIESIFLHIIGNEWLVSQLVGREVEPAMGITFFFNGDGKCCKYSVDLDFVGAFMIIVKDPVVVGILLGRALIADNCMFGVIDEPREPEEEDKPAVLTSEQVSGLEEKFHAQADKQSEYRRVLAIGTPPSRITTEKEAWRRSRDTEKACLRAVGDYFATFTKGYKRYTHREFLRRHFV
ncbi:uncharacterized protein IUM83_19351 [Phytophthora cinnamomi]|uniref:uncharacterized protein n=1 Tax=Phytophthora cinnamomi TaxID=4785 RepID=UPI0035594E7A|nr:hypothetical protein IUM83_18679 [Phytophthora cinnamomi]KAG6599617.1 hypothetical protein IUM83_19351 [Phytophthora cinnamomi]